MTSVKNPTTFGGRVIEDPKIAKFLFSDVRMSWVWLVLRVWLGYQWVTASLHKIADPGWIQTGEALKGFWMGAVKLDATGKSSIGFGWYRDFLNFLLQSQSYVWFGKVVAFGELLVGIGLIVGAFVGIAAFFGALMNFNFIMAGAASTNGLLLLAALLLVLAWKIAGYIGADYFLLRKLGVPWTSRKAEGAQPQGSVSPVPSGR